MVDNEEANIMNRSQSECIAAMDFTSRDAVRKHISSLAVVHVSRT